VDRELPMFPLGAVLFPGVAMPLHVFEPRYRALTGWCLEHDGCLGIVLIERGSEVGGGDTRFSVGTQGRIADSVALPDGRWLLAVIGERRIRVDAWLGEEPFPRAAVTFLDDAPPAAKPANRSATATGAAQATRDAIAGRVARAIALLAELGDVPADTSAPELADDPALATWQAAALGLVGPADAQRLLEVDGLDERIGLMASLLDEEIDVLALRAAGR
jgi:Lon protease-like protein